MLISDEDPAPKNFRGGTHRLVGPAETVARIARLAPAMGITRIANVTGLDCIGIPVTMVCRPNSRSVSVAQGKGMDLPAARASGLMEAVEGYHAEHILQSLKLASYEELRYSHNLIDPTLLQMEERCVESPVLWIEGKDIVEDEPVWLPFEIVHTNYTVGPRPGAGCFPGSSNGLASGNHLLEAVSHGICEVVERDATARWGLRDDALRSQTRLDVQSIDDPDCLMILEKFSRAGVSLAIWDTTSEIGVPAFLCMISDAQADPRGRLYGGTGMGCHPTREIALLRALTEAAQSRLTLIAGSRDDISKADYDRLGDPEAHSRAMALIESEQLVRRFRDIPSWDSDTFADDVRWEFERLHTAGIAHPILVDLTREEFQIPVVRIVIPGLHDLHPGAAAETEIEQRRAGGHRPPATH